MNNEVTTILSGDITLPMKILLYGIVEQEVIDIY